MYIELLERRCFLSLAADANNDRKVDTDDFTAMAAHFGQSGQTKSTGDFDASGVVNGIDFNVLASEFGKVEMATYNWLGTVSGNLGNLANYLGSPLSVPASGDTLIVDTTAVGFVRSPSTNTGTPVTALAALSLLNGAEGASTVFNNIPIGGNVITQDFSSVGLFTVGGTLVISGLDTTITAENVVGNISNSGGNAAIEIFNKSGNSSVNITGSLIVDNLGTAQIVIGSSASTQIISSGAASSKVSYTSASGGGVPVGHFGFEFLGTISADNVALDLDNSDLSESVQFAFTNNGYVFSAHVASPSIYATRTQSTIARGATITGTYSSGLFHDGIDMLELGGVNLAVTDNFNGTWSVVVPNNHPLGLLSMILGDTLQENIFADMPDITVVAAAPAIGTGNISGRLQLNNRMKL